MSSASQKHPVPPSSRSITDLYENPYYLHATDHAGLVLLTDRLSSGSEFHSWRRSVRMALNVRNKLGFIDGTIPKSPLNHRDSGSWSRCNDMVVTWLMNSVSKKIGQSLLFMSTAESIWRNLLARFKQDDAPRVYEIEQRLSTIQKVQWISVCIIQNLLLFGKSIRITLRLQFVLVDDANVMRLCFGKRCSREAELRSF